MELNFKGLEMQKLNTPTSNDLRADEKNEVICRVIMFTSRVMIFKMSKMAPFLCFLLITAKHLSQFGQDI